MHAEGKSKKKARFTLSGMTQPYHGGRLPTFSWTSCMHRMKEREKRSYQSKIPFVYAQGMREEKQAIETTTGCQLLATIIGLNICWKTPLS